MPIPCPHFKITIVKRSQGQSAVAGAAYQSGERLFSEYDQKTKFYNKKKELVHAEIMLPSHAPPGFADRADPLERRGSRGEPVELPACPAHCAGVPGGGAEGAVCRFQGSRIGSPDRCSLCPVHDGVQPQLRRFVRRRWWWRKPQQQWRWRRGRQRVRLPDRYCSGRGADPDRLGWLNQSLQVKHRFSLWGFFESACRKRRSMIG